MSESENKNIGGTDSESWLRRKNRRKSVRIAIQVLLIAVLLYLFCATVVFPKSFKPYEQPVEDGAEENTEQSETVVSPGFIAISYPGVTAVDEPGSGFVSQRAFEEQMAALYASGYVAVTQQDILDYYRGGKVLPEKALFLVFEDGTLNTTSLVQPSLEQYNYIATISTYAINISDSYSRFATASDIRRLLKNSFWELGSGGYRLSYINVFSRYGNYYGHLNTDEFVCIDDYLRRDYNHYLMDFLRDGDRLRQESAEQMNARVGDDYALMHEAYESQIGFMPQLYILMHSNTGAFGNDPLVSARNRDMLTAMFPMNFNREGSCSNTLESSVYDLTRLQSRSYFSTNHLLMRIMDDTGDSVAFVTGDEAEAERWYGDSGVAEYKDNKIILTTEPYGKGQITLKSELMSDIDMSVTLAGNKVGVQSVYLRTNRELSNGIQVALENDELAVRELGVDGGELFRLSLFEFDGGPFKSEQEDEYEGLEALYNAIIQYDSDAARVEEARQKLSELHTTYPMSLAEGGDPFVPALDIAQHDSRRLRIRLTGKRLNVWLDGKLVAENLPLSSESFGNVALGAGVWNAAENYSQVNYADDVYDAVFIDPVISDADDTQTVLYSYQLSNFQKMQASAQSTWDKLREFFLTLF